MDLISKGSVASLAGGLTIALLFLFAAYLFYTGSVDNARLVSIISSIALAGLGAWRFTVVEKKHLPITFMALGAIMLLIQLAKKASGSKRD